MSPEKILMFSLPESDSQSAFYSPDPDHNGEEQPLPEPNPAPPSDLNPNNLLPNQEAYFDAADGSSPSREVTSPNPCPTDQIKEPVENVVSCTNKNKEPVENVDSCADQNNKPVGKTDTLAGSGSHGPKKQFLVACSERGAERATEIENVGTVVTGAVPRKLPTWGSNQNGEDGKGGHNKAVTEKKGNDFALPLPLPQNLQQVVERFSAGFDEKKYAGKDLLEIAGMKGIVFDNPSWWPAEGFPDSLGQENAGAASGKCV